ncbi:MAG: alpha/beta hydrolase [Thermoanaerobaculia bacterium]|nr:alpha/beta hydrolase [Thermoanaerobaculia bacterium]
MKRTALALGLAVACLTAPLLAAEAPPRLLALDIEPDLVYGHKMGMALTLDVIKPAQANGAAVLFMVSGGWVSRWAPPDRTAQRFQDLLDAGFTVIPVRHGSSPLFKVPDAVEDVRRAVRFVRANADAWGIDPERLGVFGGSAGGHLSLMLGTASDAGDAAATDPVLRSSSRVAAVVAYFPPVDLVGLAGPNDRFPALDFDAKLAEGISPIYHVSADDPPTLMIHGDADELVPLSHSERILAAFQKAGVATELIVLEGAGHGFQGDDAAKATAALVTWFRDHLVPAPAAQSTGSGG